MRMIFLVAAAAFLMLGTRIGSAQGIVETVAEGCKSELQSYCSQVTPGEQRVLACLYAHNDKLSGQCQNALYDAAVELEKAINALKTVAVGCERDIDTVCADVIAGEGRILQCLIDHQDQVSDACGKAMTEVGMR